MDTAPNNFGKPFNTIGNWRTEAILLKQKFPQLTDEDLVLEEGKEYELLTRIGNRLKIKPEDANDIIKAGQQNYADVTITLQNKYLKGQIVYAKVNPALALIVRRHVDRIYYCTIQQNPTQKELVYFERELV